MSGQTEREVILLSLTGEEFIRAVETHSRMMFRAARAVLPCDADAEDAVSQALLLAWQSRHRLRDPSAVRPWLVKIAVNCARRAAKRSNHFLPLEAAERISAPEQGELYTTLWDAVLALPEEQRGVVVLFYYEDLTVDEIAKLLRIPAGTVKSRISRARERLKRTLCEEVTL